ncbi:MAG TPA: hypothetical protein PLI09_16235 [Candidatus Hydrogenedentes bacterium]|nr:hypothetical protein [Candidatus Hydrogenedentota bacterium]
METHFLSESVAGLKRQDSESFNPMPWYNPNGDCIMYQTANEAVVAERIDEFLTIYRSAIDNRPIGFELKEVMALIQSFGYDTLSVHAELQGDKLISVRALYLAAYERTQKSIKGRHAYASAPLPEPEKDIVKVPVQRAA